MKTLRLTFIDFWSNFNPDDFILTKIIRKKYDVQIVDSNPDFVFCSCFNFKVLNYNCPRIFFTGECIFPDFNIYDYALGFNNFTYQDRYMRFPLWLFYEKSVELAKKKYLLAEKEILAKKKFCNFVVSNSEGAEERKTLFEALNSYKRVDSAGKYLNNMGVRCADKLDFQKDYKFSCAFENYKYDGYITEKIMDAFAAGTIPIYFGTDCISKEFNPKSFINYNDFSSPKELVEYVKKIDSDDEAFLRIIHEPVFSENCNAYNNFISDDCNKVLDFFTNIFENNWGVLRRNIGCVGKIHENSIKYSLLKDFWLYPSGFSSNEKKIIVIGAGKIGQSLVKQIDLLKSCELVSWLDNNYKKINNPRVKSVEQITDMEYDFVVIAMKNKDNSVDIIKEQLVGLGVDKNKIIWREPFPLSDFIK